MNWLKSRWHVPVIAFVPFLFFWKLFLPAVEERLIFRGDFLNQHYVWKSYALTQISKGDFPLWNPHVLGGVALHANPQIGLFYPPMYVLAPFLDGSTVDYRALEAYQLAHLSLAGIGICALLSAFGVPRLPSLAAGLVIMTTGFFTTPGHHALVVTASWIPWVLFAVKKRIDTGGFLVLGSLAVALLILAGHPQVTYYGLLIAGAFALWSGGARASFKRAAPIAGIGILLAAVQWLPTLQLAGESNRAETGYEYSTTFDFSSYFLSASLMPRGQIVLPGQDGASPLHLYVGVGTLLLALVGLMLSSRSLRWFFAAVAATGFFLSLGQASILFDVFYLGVPGFSQFRIPYRLLGIYSVGMAGLAALGLEVIASSGRKHRRRLRTILVGWWVLAAAMAIWSGPARAHLDSISLAPAQIERIQAAMFWAIALIIANGLVLSLRLWQPRYTSVSALFLVLLFLDLGAFVKDRGQHPAATLVRAGERPIHRLARSQSYLARHVSNSNLESYSMLHGTHFLGGQDSLIDGRFVELLSQSNSSANVLSVLNAKFIGRTHDPKDYPWCGQRYASPLPILDVTPGLSPAQIDLEAPIEYRELEISWSPLAEGGSASVTIDGDTYALTGTEPLRISRLEPRPLSRIMVEVAAGNPGVRIDDLEIDLNPIGLLADTLRLGSIRLNLHTLPRAFFAETIDEEPAPLDPKSLDCWTVHRPIHIEAERGGESNHSMLARYRRDLVTISEYTADRIVMKVRAPRDGFVILADTFRPGWSVLVDDELTPVFRAQSALRAVPVHQGEHTVRWIYQPASLSLGAALSLLGVAVLLGSALWRRVARTATKRSVPSKGS